MLNAYIICLQYTYIRVYFVKVIYCRGNNKTRIDSEESNKI